jgi:hypothetical protein
MTIDERLDRLTERHEALTQSVELVLTAQRQDSEDIRALARTAQQDGENIRALGRAVEQDGENIRGLARIAEIHERRLTDLEGGE